MVSYADPAVVAAALKLDPDQDDYAARMATIASLSEALSRVLDEKCGRTFGGGVIVPETRETSVNGYDTLTLPWAALTITGIATGGEWNGSGWTDETALTAADWRVWQQDRAGRIWALRNMRGTWSGHYRITSVWADNPGGDVPADVTTLVTHLVINHDLLFRTSAAGMEGPDGNGIRPMNPWSLEISKALIKKYYVPQMVV